MSLDAYDRLPAGRSHQARVVEVLDAPSNLGLRPPAPGTVPGVYKLAGALRDHRLIARLGAVDAGVVTPPRYLGAWRPGAGVRNEASIHRYSIRLADRIEGIIEGGNFPLVLGGDCSIILGAMLALRRRGRFGLAFVDGHSDFRHPGNAPFVGAAAGEDLALVTGRGGDLADLESRRPLVDDLDVVAMGVRDHDPELREVESGGIKVFTAGRIREIGAGAAAAEAVRILTSRRGAGYWIHCDVDVLDETVMPAVDTPEPGGLGTSDLIEILAQLLASGLAVGMDVAIYDPDLDETGDLASVLTSCLCVAVAESAGLPKPAASQRRTQPDH